MTEEQTTKLLRDARWLCDTVRNAASVLEAEDPEETAEVLEVVEAIEIFLSQHEPNDDTTPAEAA